MEIPVPPPYVAAYKLYRIDYVIDKKTNRIRPAYDASKPTQVVNTAEIEQYAGNPQHFIFEWQEVHPTPFHDNNGAIRFEDHYVTRTHVENKVRVLKIFEAYEAVLKDPNIEFAPPDIVSLEYELMEKGWRFAYTPGTGPVIDPSIPVNWFIQDDHPAQSQQSASEVITSSSPQPDAAVLPNTVDYKLDLLIQRFSQLTDLLESALVPKNAPANSE